MTPMEEYARQVEESLEAGRLEPAMATARQMFQSGEDSAEASRALGQSLKRLYHNLSAAAVHAFREALLREFPDIVESVFAPLKPDIELTLEWNRRLDGLANERLLNEIIDNVKSKDLDAADASARALIMTATTAEGRAQRAKQIGYTMGGLIHEKDRAQALVKMISRAPQKYGIDFVVATDVEEDFTKSSNAAARRERPVGATSRTELTQVTVELSRALPQRMAINEPGPEDIIEFDRNMRAIFRCCLLSYEFNRFYEATLLMVEFSSKEMSTAGAMAGVEQRLFMTLGRTARMVAARVFKELGQNQRAFSPYFAYTQKQANEKVGKYAVEALGLLQNSEAVPFLMQVMGDRKANVRAEAIFALGAIADERAQNVLLQSLAQDLRARIVEGEARRDAFAIIRALGQIARAEQPEARSHLTANVIKLLPQGDTEFQVRTVLNFFIGKLDSVDRQLLNWAAQVGTSALWSIDRPELARAGQASPLGFRQPLIDLLLRLAPFVMNVINATAMENLKTYGGAYLAMGEFYGKAGDETSLPVIRQMIFNTLLHDDTKPKSQYTKQMVIDTATEQKTEIDSDRILASLIYAADKIGGAEAEDILEDLYDRVQTGRLPAPGRETSDILMQAHMNAAKRQGRSAFDRPVAAQSEGSDLHPGEEPQAPAPASLSPEDIDNLNALEARYLIAAKRRAAKIAAMVGLANRKVTAGIAPIIKHLGDADPMIAAGAETALVDYGSGNAPGHILNPLMEALLSKLEMGDNPTRVKIANVLMKLNPRKPAIAERLEKFASNPTLDLPVRSILDRVRGVGGGTSASTTAVAGSSASAAPDSSTPGSGEAKPAAAVPENIAKFLPRNQGEMSDLDRKRAYMMARQEWIRNGKRGPEPQPPQ